MEFFRIVEVQTTDSELQNRLVIERLPEFCDSIPSLLECTGNEGRIFCLWGEFVIHREVINGGVRFALPGCPNALAWTVTTGYPPVPDKVLIHCTINRVEVDPDLKESIDTFLDDWKEGIARTFSGITSDNLRQKQRHFVMA